MMGSNDMPQDELFYAFNLSDVVPQDHLLRDIDRVLDLSGLREHLAPYYSHTGRPSIDPELMIRMMLIGYCLGIRSDRLLCEEVKLNLAYRWFCKLKITDLVPDHSTFSKNRTGRFRESDALRFVFEKVLKRCMEEGLIGGDLVVSAGSKTMQLMAPGRTRGVVNTHETMTGGGGLPLPDL